MAAQHFPFQDTVIVFFHAFLLSCFRQKVSLCAQELLIASGAGWLRAPFPQRCLTALAKDYYKVVVFYNTKSI